MNEEEIGMRNMTGVCFVYRPAVRCEMIHRQTARKREKETGKVFV